MNTRRRLLTFLGALGLAAKAEDTPPPGPWSPEPFNQDPPRPRCPVCRRAGSWPNQALTLTDTDGRTLHYKRARVFICDGCGNLYAHGYLGELPIVAGEGEQ